jgi:hypothetical protein
MWPRPSALRLKAQGAHDVRYLRYWVIEAEGKIFCLVDAPSAEAANTVHREAHGLAADDVFEVQGRVVTRRWLVPDLVGLDLFVPGPARARRAVRRAAEAGHR